MALSSYCKFLFPTGSEKAILTSCVKGLLGGAGLCQTAVPYSIPLTQETDQHSETPVIKTRANIPSRGCEVKILVA